MKNIPWKNINLHVKKVQKYSWGLALLLCISLIYTYVYSVSSLKKTGYSLSSSSLTDIKYCSCMAIDNDGYVWIGTNSGLNVFDGVQIKQFFKNDEKTQSIPSNNINDLMKDSHGKIWIATDRGVAAYAGNELFTNYTFPKAETNITQLAETSDGKILAQSCNHVFRLENGKFKIFINERREQIEPLYLQHHICPDCQGGFWTIEPKTLKCFSKYGKTVQVLKNTYNLKANMTAITRDGNKLWIAQSRHITCINLKTNKRIYFSKKQIPVLPSSIVPDGCGNLLIKSHKLGLFKFIPSTRQMTEITPSDFPLRHSQVMISCMKRTANGTFYIGFRNLGFDIISKEQLALRKMDNTNLQMRTRSHNIRNLTFDGHYLWGNLDDNIFRYNLSSDQFLAIPLDNIFDDSPYFRQDFQKILPLGKDYILVTNVRFSLCHNQINGLKKINMFNTGNAMGDFTVNGNTAYIAADAHKIYYYTIGSKQYHSIPVKNESYDSKAHLLSIDSTHLLVVCENADILMVNLKTHRNSKLYIKHPKSLNNTIITCAMKDKAGHIWIGTRYDGFAELSIKGLKITVAKTPIPELEITNISDIKDGRLCITTNHSIYIYNPKNNECMMYREIQDNLNETHINANSVVYLHNHLMALGVHDGCCVINATPRPCAQHNGKIRNIFVTTNTVNQPLSLGNIHDKDKIVLRHNQNDLQIIFGEVQFTSPLNKLYSYRLNNQEEQWHHTDHNFQVSYPNLLPGHYIFQVKSSTFDNDDTAQSSISILILPPLWFSWQAICLYLLFAFWLVYYINSLYLKNRADKLELSVKERENKQERRSNEMNQRFFANVSHEFRNPLTMIVGPIMSMQRDHSLPANTRHSLNIVSLSVKRMLQLIDQMLDFNKLEDDVLRLQVELCDFSEITRIQIEILKETASYHHIHVNRKGLDDPQLLWIDKDKIEKIMSNLFTNALKHTPDGGEISIICQTAKDRKLSISIYNNGKHIPEDKLPYVFARYYQVKEINENHNYGFGTGLGLYYVRQLVKLHHGSISASNVPNGGVVFSLLLPHDDIYSDSEKRKKPVKYFIHEPVPHINFKKFENPNEDITGLRPEMLVVDDDTDLALYITSIFDSIYHVKSVYSAESALEYLKNHQPDIILSDVVMDEINGLDFCRILKNDMSYSHIPIVLISAKSNIQEQIEGLNVGAIAYIVKPFDPDMLKALVKSQMQNMDEIRKQLRENTSAQIVSDTLSPQDRKFMDEVYTLMEQQLTMENINIPSVCNEMHVSRTKFNYKIKQLTDMTPSTFFRTYKLNRAAKLLRDGECNVSEAAMQTGFNNLSYFSTIFKKQFGISPSEYK